MTDVSRRPADRSLPPLYPIIDIDLCRMRGRAPLALAEACLEGGARLLQVRGKAAGGGTLLATCRAVVAAAAACGARVVVNDRADLAVISGAAGVHVGQQDLPVETVRRIVGPGRLIGLSTHAPGQVDDALAGDADYVAVGPIYLTATKDTGYEPRGLDLIRYAARGGRPVVAIGGITLETAREVRDAGAASLAVIGDLLADGDPRARVEAYLARLSA